MSKCFLDLVIFFESLVEHALADQQEWYNPEASRSNTFWNNPEVVQHALSHWVVHSDGPAKSLRQGRRAN